RRRALAAASAHQRAGECTRARTIATDVLGEADIGPLRAEALVLLAELEGLHPAVPLLEEALRGAVSRPALQWVSECRLAVPVRLEKGFDGALEHARAALELADDLDDDALRVHALAILTFFGCGVGDADAPAHATRAHELATAVGDVELLEEATDALVKVFDERRDVDAARALLEPVYHQWRERDELRAAGALSSLAFVELWGGRWQLAAEDAATALGIHVQYGFDVPWNHLATAVVAAHRGQLE